MAHYIEAGVEVSVDGSIWYKLTDDNRQPIKIVFEVIEKTNRMADGTLRRYVIARKHKISTSWQTVWSKTSMSSDYGTYSGKAGVWMRSFYEANVFTPIKLKLIVAGGYNGIIDPNAPSYNEDDYFSSKQSSVDPSNPVYTVYITNFDYEVVNRNSNYDLVNINIEFTEV